MRYKKSAKIYKIEVVYSFMGKGRDITITRMIPRRYQYTSKRFFKLSSMCDPKTWKTIYTDETITFEKEVKQ